MPPRSSTLNGSRRARISDTALMLALAHTLIVEGLHDADFCARLLHGLQSFPDYLLATKTGVAKSADWAAGLSEISAEKNSHPGAQDGPPRAPSSTSIGRCKRGDHGEQPVWGGDRVASVLGQVACRAVVSASATAAWKGLATMLPDMPVPTLSAGHNPVRSFHPVARNRGACCSTRSAVSVQRAGSRLIPDIDLVYLCGGNPVHHHQDINRLIRAWSPPFRSSARSVVDTTRPCDIVLPTTTDARARRHRRQRARPIHHRDEAGDRPVGESATTLQSSAISVIASALRVFYRGPATPFSGLRHIYETARAHAESSRRGVADLRRVLAQAAISKFPEASTPQFCSEKFR